MPSQVDMMGYEFLMNGFRALGLRILDNGVVRDDNYEYGYFTKDTFRSMDGIIQVPVKDIKNIAYEDQARIITLMMSDVKIPSDRDIPVKGRYKGTLDEEDFVIIEEDPRPQDEGPKMAPTTLSGLSRIFTELYPNSDTQIFYNELTEKYVIDMTMLGRPGGLKPLSDSILRMYHEDFEKRLAECGYFVKKMPSELLRDEVLLLKMDEHTINPFRDYVEAQVWDGIPRLRMWFRDTFGATAPALSKEDELLYLGDVAQAWFLGAIGRMYGACRHEIVPVFIGIQGIGKGHALEYTAGKSEFYTMTMVDPTAPGGVKEFLDGVRGRVIVELGEATQFKGDADKMKNFITQTYDQMRKPYKAMDEEYPRHFILASSSNFDNIFTDSSGNRRFFPMYCNPKYQTRIFSTEDRSQGQYDVDQLWAEALYMYRHGQKAFIYGEAEKRAEKMQKYCTSENANSSIIKDALDDPSSVNPYRFKGALVNKQIIMRVAFGCTTRAQMMNKDYIAAFNDWANNLPSGEWEKLENVSVEGSRPGRAYRRLIEPGEVVEKGSKFLMVPTVSDSTDIEGIMAQSEIRRLTRDFGLEIGDIVPQEALDTVEDVDMLIRFDYFMTDTVKGKTVYRVGEFE